MLCHVNFPSSRGGAVLLPKQEIWGISPRKICFGAPCDRAGSSVGQPTPPVGSCPLLTSLSLLSKYKIYLQERAIFSSAVVSVEIPSVLRICYGVF